MFVRALVNILKLTHLSNFMTIKLITIYLMSFLYVFTGIKHFIDAKWFMQIMPPYLPNHLQLVYISGAFALRGPRFQFFQMHS